MLKQLLYNFYRYKKSKTIENNSSIATSSADERSAVHKMAKTKSALDKLVRFLKVESIYNYTISCQSTSINR